MPNTEKSRNPWIGRGVRRYGRSQHYSLSGKYKVKNRITKAPEKPQPEKKKNVPFQKGERALVRPRAPKYPADDVPKRLYNRKTRNPPKVRKSLSAGTILILLSGKFRGSRVVLLKVLESGLLLVTGPYSVNGVPLKRVNPAYVIATSTKIDLKEVSNDLNDQVFRRPTKEKTPKTPEQRFEKQEEQKKERVLDPNRLNLQKKLLMNKY